MPSYSENISLVRQRLGAPDPQSPADHVILNVLIEHISDHCAQLQNTRNHWSVERCEINVSPGQEDYLITGANFGRPFLVYTVDPANQYHWRREVPFTLMQDADQGYQGPQQAQSAYPWSAAEMVFYRQGVGTPAWKVRPYPIPGIAATYECWYETAYEFGGLADRSGLEFFHHLVRVQTALSLLPLCSWGDISIKGDLKTWQAQVASLRDVLRYDEERYQKQFDSYKAQSSREGVSKKRGVGWQYERDWECGDVGMLSDPRYI
jgi:hypothetical protein